MLATFLNQFDEFGLGFQIKVSSLGIGGIGPWDLESIVAGIDFLMEVNSQAPPC